MRPIKWMLLKNRKIAITMLCALIPAGMTLGYLLLSWPMMPWSGAEGASSQAGAGVSAGTGATTASGAGAAADTHAGITVSARPVLPAAAASSTGAAVTAGMTDATRLVSLDRTIAGKPAKIFIIEVNTRLGAKNIRIAPVLSQDSIFGFEKVSDMLKRTHALGGIDAGFFHQYGQPAGMVIIGGKLLASSAGTYPSIVQNTAGEIYFGEVHSQVYVRIGGKAYGVDTMNRVPDKGEVTLFTSEYGSTTRSSKPTTNIVVQNGAVTKVLKTHGAVDIPEGGMVLCAGADRAETFSDVREAMPFKMKYSIGDGYGEIESAYQCGSWIVRNGVKCIKDQDEWVGQTLTREPRTVAGMKKDGTLVLMVVDGRQNGYSMGMNGNDLALFLTGYGVDNAAMLDGGASSVMFYNGKMINRPSYRGEERDVGGAIGLYRR